MAIMLLYVTCGSEDEARAIASALVEEGLAACANILPGMRSLYRWEGAVQEEGETVLLLKTDAALAERATARAVALHSYDCPCVVALPVAAGNPAFLDWVTAETKGRQPAS